ncbi:MAG: nicotinamide mononucleotide transporter [Clostridia bacterium]|nr:nicotinamide mononucleotide transporter [Clostridia bacterium]
MKLHNPFKDLTKFEWTLWLCSLVVVSASFLLSPDKDYLTLVCSLIGVTALIFVAKGYVFGLILSVVFAVFYGIISFFFRYYGEMITYLGMSAPIALVSIFTWLKNPYKDTPEVTVAKLSKKEILFMLTSSLAITIAFYFILKAFHTTNLFFSTISVTTSYLASYLSFKRSPYYACAYAGNDIILIILWILASIENISYLPMIFCFIAFLFNDLYAFFNWRRMQNRQNEKN